MEYLREKKKPRTASSSCYSDWANLPEGMLYEILDKLVSVSDFVRFSTVCTRWRGVALDERKIREESFNQHHQLPILMMLPQVTNVNSYFLNNDYNPYIGSSFGWVIVSKGFYKISLHNPFSSTYRNRPIHLPRLEIYPHCKVSKAVLSGPPVSASGYVVAVIFHDSGSNMIAFLQVNNNNNKQLESGEGIGGNKENKQLVWTCRVLEDEISDLIFDEDGELLLLDSHNRVLSCNFNDPLPVVKIKFDTPFPPLCVCHGRFLSFARVDANIVKSTGGDILLVIRSKEIKYYYKPNITVDLIVYKLDASGPKWIEVDSLGSDILFLGHNNASISVSKFDFPRCTPGCVFYSDIRKRLCVRSENPYHATGEGPTDVGDFDVQDKCLVKSFNLISDSCIDNPAIWVSPTL